MTPGPAAPSGADDGSDRTTGVLPTGRPSVPGVRLDKEIGRGGFSTVYRGHQISVDRDVAVKVDTRRLADARDRRRFAREIVAAGMVSAHPHIVTLYDGGITADDHPYLVMELYSGGSYADRIRSQGPIPVTEVLDVGFAIADALVAAHGEGILHRDVKPGNILISRYGSPALADFGLAALPPGGDGYSVTMESLTPSYAAPEAFGGFEPTVAMDIYALGATLYAMLQGRPPRSDPSGSSPPIATLLLLLNEPLPPIPGPGTEDLMGVIWRATATLPGERYPTAAALRDALAAVRAGRPQAAGGIRPAVARTAGADPEPSGPPAPTPTGPPPADEHSLGLFTPDTEPSATPARWPVIAAAVAVVVVLAVGAVLLRTAHLSGQPIKLTAGTTASAGPSASSAGSPTSGSGRTVFPPITPSRTATPPPASSPAPSTAPSSGPSTAPSSVPSTRPSPSPSASAAGAPAVGTCFAGLVEIGDHITATPVASCDRPHSWEAYATGVLDPATPTPYASALAKDPVVKRTCTQGALQGYLGPTAHGTFDTDVIPPTDVDFLQGRRGFWCVAAVHDAGEVTGSLRQG